MQAAERLHRAMVDRHRAAQVVDTDLGDFQAEMTAKTVGRNRPFLTNGDRLFPDAHVNDEGMQKRGVYFNAAAQAN